MTEPQHKVDDGGAVPSFTVNDRCEKAREYAGLSQEELAEIIGVHRQTVGHYELGTVKTLKVLVLRAWAEACGVDPDWLIGDDPDPSNARNPRYGNFRVVTTEVTQSELPLRFGQDKTNIRLELVNA